MKTHDSKEKIVQDRKLWTGLALFKIIAINPTPDQMETLGIRKPQKDPVYTQEIDNGAGGTYTRTRLDFYMKSPIINVKMALFVDSRDVLSRDGKKNQYINNHAQVSWAKDVDSLPDFFVKETARISHVGEERLHRFLWAWGNVQTYVSEEDKAKKLHQKDVEASLNTMPKIIKGDLKELRGYVTNLATNEVRLLLGVRDMTFQDVYTGFFGRASSESHTGWVKALKNDFTLYDADYQGSLAFQAWTAPDNIEIDVKGSGTTSEEKVNIQSDFD